jgi:hypothetical protein
LAQSAEKPALFGGGRDRDRTCDPYHVKESATTAAMLISFMISCLPLSLSRISPGLTARSRQRQMLGLPGLLSGLDVLIN